MYGLHNGVAAVPNWAVGIVWLDAFGLSDVWPMHAIANKLCIDIGCNRPVCVTGLPVEMEFAVVSDCAPLKPVEQVPQNVWDCRRTLFHSKVNYGEKKLINYLVIFADVNRLLAFVVKIEAKTLIRHQNQWTDCMFEVDW